MATAKPHPFHVIPRSEWGARPPRGAMAEQAPPTEAFLHYSDSSDLATIDSRQEAFAAARSIQNFHIDGRGWSDIAYHYLLLQLHGIWGETMCLAGRSSATVPAAQLNHNTGTLAICVYAGALDTFTTRTIYTIERCVSLHASVRTIGGHRDVTSTDCPGDRLYSLLPRIANATARKVYRHGS